MTEAVKLDGGMTPERANELLVSAGALVTALKRKVSGTAALAAATKGASL